jgi:molybdopterin-containing oxidoreductase family iron-sulfur binding subunit
MRKERVKEQKLAEGPGEPLAFGRRQFASGLGGLTSALVAGQALRSNASAATTAAEKLPTKEEFFAIALQQRNNDVTRPGPQPADLTGEVQRRPGALQEMAFDQAFAQRPETSGAISAAIASPDPPPSNGTTQEGALDRMEADVARALQKPSRDWGMVIDLRKCIACKACTVACKAENVTSPGVSYRVVMEQEVGTYPNSRRTFLPRPCFQCDNPPCVPVCPVGATWKQEEDGIVVIDYDACIGCRYCEMACPYGARYFDFGEYYNPPEFRQEYEVTPIPEYRENRVRENGASPIGNVRKCTFCLHRVNEGMLPACVATCVGRALHFGDLDDPESLVFELLNSHATIRLKEELGTEPSVYYLI